MTILVVSPFCPWPMTSGGHTRLFNVIKHLSAQHVVDLVCMSTPGAENRAGDLERFCRRIHWVEPAACGGGRGVHAWRRHLRRLGALCVGVPLEISAFYNPAMRNTLERLLRTETYDVVQVEFARMAQHFGRRAFARYPALKILSDYDMTFLPHLRRYQCERRRLRRAARYVDYRMTRFYALRTWRRFDELVLTSRADRDRVLAASPGLHIRVVPNGVDLDGYSMLPESAEPGRLLFLGGAVHYPNVDGLFFFLDRILPRVRQLLGDVTVHVIGAGWDDHRHAIVSHPSVEVTGFVPDIRSHCRRSDVMVVPIRIGGGTRLKILEAMALGIPVVSTSVGCEGIDAEDRRDVLVADDPDDFASRIGEIWADGGLRDALTRRARTLVTERYGWDKLSMYHGDLYSRGSRSLAATTERQRSHSGATFSSDVADGGQSDGSRSLV